MNQSKFRHLAITAILFNIFIAGCDLGPGSGGKSTIEGKIKTLKYNSSGVLVSEYPAADERVYLIYGDDTIFTEDERTSYEGSYRFTFLRKGAYQIFAYSDCNGCPSGTEAVIVTVEITDNGGVYTAPEIVIADR